MFHLIIILVLVFCQNLFLIALSVVLVVHKSHAEVLKMQVYDYGILSTRCVRFFSF